MSVEGVVVVEKDGRKRYRNMAPVWAHEADGSLHLYDADALVDFHSSGDVKELIDPVEFTPSLMDLGVTLVQVGAAQVEIVEEPHVE